MKFVILTALTGTTMCQIYSSVLSDKSGSLPDDVKKIIMSILKRIFGEAAMNFFMCLGIDYFQECKVEFAECIASENRRDCFLKSNCRTDQVIRCLDEMENGTLSMTNSPSLLIISLVSSILFSLYFF